MDAAAERGVEQAARRKQPGVAILLDHPVRQAGDDRALREDAAGDPFEANVRVARRKIDHALLGDQGVAVQPSQIERPVRGAIGVAIDGDRDRLRAGRSRHGLAGGRPGGDGGEKGKEASGPHRPVQ